MSTVEQIITIGICAIATILTRFLPFIIFKDGRTPKYIQYLGKALPSAIFAMLVVYCLKDVNVIKGNHGIPEFVALIATTGLHLMKQNMFISIIGGTLLYILIVNPGF